MNTMKSVYSKLFKEETQLAAHEVELATVQSVDKLDVAALKLRDKSQANVKKAKDALINANNSIGETLAAFEKVVVEVDTLEKQAKDLGLGLPTKARRAKDSAVREISIYNSLRTAINAAKF